ncbi:MAG: C-GCAxxG-C-C family protein [Bacteroidales bacterium]|nr:C-GCAxxG-C-C family protein [Bacteroidales bacterium]
MTRQEAIDKVLTLFNEGYACSQSILLAFGPEFNVDEQSAKLLSATFGGGMGRLREKCGAVTGSFMVQGLAYAPQDPKDMDNKLLAYRKVRELNKALIDVYGTTSCGELLQKFATREAVEKRQHHQLICTKILAETAGKLYDMLHEDGKI